MSSDKAGFGQWVLSTFGGSASTGVEVIARTDSNYDHDVAEVASIIRRHALMPANETAALRQAAAQTAKSADWKYFIARYEEAYGEAMRRRDERLAKA